MARQVRAARAALPTPNEYRTGSGAPGPKYWQQKADYVISVELNDGNQSLTGSETITYHNNSPDVLKYLWMQLDQNILAQENSLNKTNSSAVRDLCSCQDVCRSDVRLQKAASISKV